jgi:putative ABC transport system permease protein
MLVDIFEVAAQVGLQYGPFVLGLYLVFTVLSFPDLTVEGSFALGGGTSATLIFNGHHPLLALAAGLATGAGAGVVTGLLHVRLRINALLAGILTATALWSVNLFVMGRGNIGITQFSTVFTWLEQRGLTPQHAAIVLGAAACALCAGLLVTFLRTEFGLSLRATGRNIQTARALGVPTERRQLVGLMVANGLAGLSGALVVQNQGFADVQAGVGVIVVGLAGLAIGRSFIRSNRLVPGILGALLGIYVYRVIVAWALRQGLPSGNIRLITALVVVVAIVVRTQLRSYLAVPGSKAAAVRRRNRVEFLENDVVAPIL